MDHGSGQKFRDEMFSRLRLSVREIAADLSISGDAGLDLFRQDAVLSLSRVKVKLRAAHGHLKGN
jgi:hypothetical protein